MINFFLMIQTLLNNGQKSLTFKTFEKVKTVRNGSCGSKCLSIAKTKSVVGVAFQLANVALCSDSLDFPVGR
jgi:hypothetical protein